NGIYSYRTSLPYTVFSGLDIRGDGSTTTQRASVVAGASPYLEDTSSLRWLNPTAFGNPAPGQYGNSARNAYRGPSYTNLDLAILKNVAAPWFSTRTSTLQLRIEVFNALNHTNFMLPVATFRSPDFGRLTAAEPARIVQLAMKFLF